MEQQFYDNLSKDYSAAAAKIPKAGGWETLTSNQQTAMLDIAYNIGLRPEPGHPGLEGSPTFWGYLVGHKFQQAADLLLKKFPSVNMQRKVDDAAYLDPAHHGASASPHVALSGDHNSLARALLDGAFGDVPMVHDHAAPHESLSSTLSAASDLHPQAPFWKA